VRNKYGKEISNQRYPENHSNKENSPML